MLSLGYDGSYHGQHDIEVGHWIVGEGETVDRCPSYYAADHERLALTPGRYPVRLRFVGGYTIPMPYWLLVGIDATRVSGALYSGCGGRNFARTDLPAGEAVSYAVQAYAYQLADLVKAGRVELHAGCEWAPYARDLLLLARIVFAPEARS